MLTQKYHYVIADLRMPCRKVQFNISGKINITCFKLLEDSDEENQKLIDRWRQEHSDDMSVFEENQARPPPHSHSFGFRHRFEIEISAVV